MPWQPTFTPAFYDLKTFDKPKPQEETPSPISPENPTARESGLQRFDSGRLERFVERESKLPKDHRFESMVDRVVEFVQTNAPILQPPMTSDRLAAIELNFAQFKEHITKENHYDVHNRAMFGAGKELLGEFQTLLHNERVPLQRRIDAISTMAPAMPLCAGGVLTAVQAGVVELRYAACGLKGAAQLKKEAMMEAAIGSFVKQKHKFLEGNHVHFVNGYFNDVAESFGLPKRNDPFDTIPQKDMTPALRTQCKELVEQTLEPVSLAAALAEGYLGELQAAVASAKLDPQGFHGGEALTKLHKVTDELKHAVLNEKFGQVPAEHYLTPQLDGENAHMHFQLTKQPEMIVKHFLDALKSEKLIDFDDTISLSKANADAGSLKMLGLMTWVERDGAGFGAEVKDLLAVSPHDMVENLAEQGIPPNEHADILKTIAQQLLEAAGATPGIINSEWAENFATACKSTLPPSLQDMQPMVMRGAEAGNPELLSALFKHGANPNAVATQDGYSALMCASRAGHLAAMKCLIDAGANLDQMDERDNTAVIFATGNRQLPALQRLVKAGANLDVVSREGDFALMLATNNGDTAAMQCLLDGGTNKNVANWDTLTPLMSAVLNDSHAAVDLLLEKGVNLDARCIKGHTVLSMAVTAGSLVSVKKLIRKGADLNNCSQAGETPAILAAGSGRAEILKELIEHGASTDTLDARGIHAAISAAVYGHPDVIKVLVDAKKDIDTADSQGMTPVLYAARVGHVEALQQLSAGGANLDAKDNETNTALTRAAFDKKLDVVRCLIDNKADLNARFQDSFTTLAIAIGMDNQPLVEMMIDAKASLEVKDSQGRTPLMFAATCGNLSAVEALVAAGAKVDTQEPDNQWKDIMSAAKQEHPEILKLLIRASAPAL
ncbi:MAG: ankyrin repeat domain-containing protein [Pseudomonadota bacterium]